MIFGQVLGADMPTPDIVDDQKFSVGVKNMQSAMMFLASVTGHPEFNPTGADGKVGMKTVYALFKIAETGAVNIPVIGNILNSFLTKAPGISDIYDCLMERRDRSASHLVCNFENAWDFVLKPNYPEWLWDNVIDPIRTTADTIYKAVNDKLNALQSEEEAPSKYGRFVKEHYEKGLAPQIVTERGGWPPGTVGVRDPILGKYRLLIPAG